MLTDSARNEVLNRLAAAEQEHNVRVQFAVESGSRAWGFASKDSDYDVRFVYVHEPDWYLSVQKKRDVIEYPIVDDYDINGWDAAKALPLLRKCNPSLIEWLYSPLVYRCDGVFAPALRRFVEEGYSPLKGRHHYMSMAKTNYRAYLQQPKVPFKKYFYTLRPLLAVRWIEQNQSVPPVEFEALLSLLDEQPGVKDEVLTLLERKRSSTELSQVPLIRVLNDFIEEELARSTELAWSERKPMDWESLDYVFRAAIKG